VFPIRLPLTDIRRCLLPPFLGAGSVVCQRAVARQLLLGEFECCVVAFDRRLRLRDEMRLLGELLEDVGL